MPPCRSCSSCWSAASSMRRCVCAPEARRRISSAYKAGWPRVIEPGGAQLQVPAHALRPGDRLLVSAGERVGADGVVLEGTGQVDQSLITGETAPLTVRAGQEVYAGSLNLTRPLQIEVTRGRQRNAARRDRSADAGGRAGQGALSQARRSRGRDLCAGRARPRARHLPRLAAGGRLMANRADLRHRRADHHLPLCAGAGGSCGADRRGEPAVPPRASSSRPPTGSSASPRPTWWCSTRPAR